MARLPAFSTAMPLTGDPNILGPLQLMQNRNLAEEGWAVQEGMQESEQDWRERMTLRNMDFQRGLADEQAALQREQAQLNRDMELEMFGERMALEERSVESQEGLVGAQTDALKSRLQFQEDVLRPYYQDQLRIARGQARHQRLTDLLGYKIMLGDFLHQKRKMYGKGGRPGLAGGAAASGAGEAAPEAQPDSVDLEEKMAGSLEETSKSLGHDMMSSSARYKQFMAELSTERARMEQALAGEENLLERIDLMLEAARVPKFAASDPSDIIWGQGNPEEWARMVDEDMANRTPEGFVKSLQRVSLSIKALERYIKVKEEKFAEREKKRAEKVAIRKEEGLPIWKFMRPRGGSRELNELKQKLRDLRWTQAKFLSEPTKALSDTSAANVVVGRQLALGESMDQVKYVIDHWFRKRAGDQGTLSWEETAGLVQGDMIRIMRERGGEVARQLEYELRQKEIEAGIEDDMKRLSDFVTREIGLIEDDAGLAEEGMNI